MLTYGIPPEFHGGVLFIYIKPPHAIGSVPSLSGQAIAYRWRSFFFFSERAARGGGGGEGALPDFFFFFPCSADHERDWPSCKVVFFGLATNAPNVRNNNNNCRESAGTGPVHLKVVPNECCLGRSPWTN